MVFRRERLLVLALFVVHATSATAADVVIWDPNNNAESQAFSKVVAAYNAKKGSAATHVKYVQLPFDAFADRVSALVPAGRGPDLFIYPQDRLGGWIQQGNIVVPVDSYVNAAARTRYIPTTLQAMMHAGSLYGVPLSYKVSVLFYNKKLVKTPPRTTTELEAMATKLTDRNAGRYGFVYMFHDYYFHAALQNGFGGRAFDQSMEPVLDSALNVRAMELLLHWKDKFLPEFVSSVEAMQAMFSEGKAAMVLEVLTFSGGIRDVDYGIATLPTITEASNRPMRPWITVDGIYMTTSCAQPHAAADFAKYATDTESAKIMALEGTQLPSNRLAYHDKALSRNAFLSTSLEQALVGIPMPNGAEMMAMWTPATTALGIVLRRSTTPQAALAKAQSEVVRNIALLQHPMPPPAHTSTGSRPGSPAN